MSQKTTKGKIVRISGPVIDAENVGAQMYDVVRVGTEELLGEVIQLKGNRATIQVYETTTGLKPGEPVITTGQPLSVKLGPGLLKSIYDGLARPLSKIAETTGSAFIPRGVNVPTLDETIKYKFTPKVKKGDTVKPGQIIGVCPETEIVEHKVMIPPSLEGEILDIKDGDFTVTEVIGHVKTKTGKKEIKLAQDWPFRIPRPYIKYAHLNQPLVTGQRVLDTFFPVAKGGTAAIPGPFGAGKTVTQQSLAKWCDAEVIVYIGCGERGNEMTEVLTEFPHLKDPKSGKPLMERTILIANTSNMPVAAREASIYTGITIAEYYRDMGYSVSLMADSTSRWAEAMREISSRLGEMPGEEGYPTYLSSRLAQFYERSGLVNTLNGDIGSVSVIGAVSPPGGDFSEPVTQNTLRLTKVFWALDATLARKRHFPAINWLTSYSLYKGNFQKIYAEHVNADFASSREEAMGLLQKESELQEVVQLVGPDALPENEKLILYTTQQLREDFLQQNAFDDVDSFCSLNKQYAMLNVILTFYHELLPLIQKGVKIKSVRNNDINELIARMKYRSDWKEAIDEITKSKESALTSFEKSLQRSDVIEEKEVN